MTHSHRHTAGRRTALTAVSVLLAVLALALLSPALPAAGAAGGTPARDIYKIGGDVMVLPDEVVDTVVVLGGHVTVAGTVRGSAVVFSGDVTLLPTGVVLGQVVCLGGKVVRDSGSLVRGNVVAIRGNHLLGRIGAATYRTVRAPFRPGTLIGWGATTILYLLVAVVAGGVWGRQTVAVRDRIARRWPACLGWGALGTLVVVPAVSVLLLITVVGVLLLVPWLLVIVPVAFFFGYVCLAALAGRCLLAGLRYRRENVMLGAVVGVAALHLLRLVPYAGAPLWALIWITGFGAVSEAAYEWWRSRRDVAKAPRSPDRAGASGAGASRAAGDAP